MPEQLARQKAGDGADDHRQEYQKQDDRHRDPLGGDMSGHKGDNQEKYQRPHQVVQSRHGDQRSGDRPVGLHIPHHGQGGRRRGGQGDPAEQKSQIEGHAGEPKNHAKHRAHHQKSTQRLRDGGDQDLRPRLFHLLPNQLRADDQAEGALKDVLQHTEPWGVQHLIAQQVQGVRTHDHTRDQPAQNGRQLQPGNELARRKGQYDRCHKPQHFKQNIHSYLLPHKL